MTLTELATRLEQATGPNWELDRDLHTLIPHEDWLFKQPLSLDRSGRIMFTSSLDAAVALCEKVLPTMTWQVETGDPTIEAPPSATVSPRCGDCPPWLDWHAEGATPALALCLAIVRALEKKQ